MISRAPNLEGGHVQSAQDDGERALAEKRAATALRLQRKQRLQAMVLKRKTNLAYLKVSSLY